jgi:membrane protein DedA with SNARE-associated domain
MAKMYAWRGAVLQFLIGGFLASFAVWLGSGILMVAVGILTGMGPPEFILAIWVLAIISCGTTWGFIAGRREFRDRQSEWENGRLKARICLNCGYDMRATPDRCPECGTIPTQKRF